jgi:hypothetical protein
MTTAPPVQSLPGSDLLEYKRISAALARPRNAARLIVMVVSGAIVVVRYLEDRSKKLTCIGKEMSCLMCARSDLDFICSYEPSASL